MEPIYEQLHDSYELSKDDFRKLLIDINANTSKDIFLKGVYFFGIQLFKDDKVYTISPPTDNIINVI